VITATLRIKVRLHKRSEVLEMLKSTWESAGAEPGCVSCHMYQDLHDGNMIVFEEVWESQADLDRHIRSDRYKYILAVMDTASEPPEIKFNTISNTGGMKVIRAARE
jgi:quinol monooxygenase YgiN